MSITDKNEATSFLKKLIKEIDSQDSCATAHPRYIVVEESIPRITRDPGYRNEAIVVETYTGEGCKFYSENELRKWFDENVGGMTYKEFNDRHVEEFYETVDHRRTNVFLTYKGYNDHIAINRHNLSDPKPFMCHAFRNQEMEDLLVSLRLLFG